MRHQFTINAWAGTIDYLHIRSYELRGLLFTFFNRRITSPTGGHAT
jgi:hypothetical protein